ncbi:MAG: pirin family protein [Planctomycetes bacterium]|nr:pirin family protein [Planctomycetota bacterium]
MITRRRSEERGHADYGWLDTYHTFSFADYHDPDWVQFGSLRVLNQDRVAPGRGFGTHGHRDMEIVSVVLQGVLEHRDSMGNGSQLRPGEVQLMSAGSGVTHSEFNASATESLHFLQMWILPRERGTAPRYEQKMFADEERSGRFRRVVSPDGRDGSLTIGQDAELYLGTLEPDHAARHELPPGRVAWLHVATGRAQIGGLELAAGDGASIRDEGSIEVRAGARAEIVLWVLPD